MLCQKRHTTVTEFAEYFHVSERTIRRDIEILSLTEPIYTKAGRYLGGIYVVDGYYMNKDYFTEQQKQVMTRVITLAERREICQISNSELSVLKEILLKYTKPA